MRLTDIAIRALPSPPKGAKIHHCDSLAGFGVRVTSTGVKAFVLTFGANRERVTIGRYPIITLADARTEAKRQLAERTLGKARPLRMSLSGALETYYKTHVSTLKESTQKEVKRLLGRFLPKRGNLEEMTVQAVTKILDKISSPSEAEHFHRCARTFFNWCVERNLLPISPMMKLRAPSHWKSRDRVLSDDELRAVWIATGKVGKQFGDIIKLLILSGQRRMEIASLRQEWLTLDAKTCTLPSDITKNKRSHTFPISTLAVDLLKTAISASSSVIFPGRCSGSEKPFNGWSKAKAQLDEKIEGIFKETFYISPPPTFTSWTLHDLRRTYATNLQRLDIRLEVIEALLNHVSGTRAGIVGVYNRHKYEAEMREAVTVFEKWFTENIAKA